MQYDPGITDSISFEELSHLKENIRQTQQGRTVQQFRQIIDISQPLSRFDDQNLPPLAPHLTGCITGTAQQRNLQQLIQASRDNHLEQFQTYTGSDVLSIWTSYIDEITTLTYSNSITACVLPLIEACINTICSHPAYLEQYSNDQKFTRYFFTLCDVVEDPLRVYRFLQSKSIAQRQAKYYLNYSTALYCRGHFRSALEILYQGIKLKVEPLIHLKNRYKYLIQCEKQRISKTLGEDIDDERLQKIIKSKDAAIVGKIYSFNYNIQSDDILLGNSVESSENDEDVVLDANGQPVIRRRGLQLVYKSEYGQSTHQTGAYLLKLNGTVPDFNNGNKEAISLTSGNLTTKSQRAPQTTGIYCDSDDGEEDMDVQFSLQSHSATILATRAGYLKENVSPYTLDMSMSYDQNYLNKLNNYNQNRGIEARAPENDVSHTLPASKITTGIYYDDDDEYE